MIKKSIFLIFIFTCLVSFAQINQTEAVALSAPKKSTINFIENKGQITDQFYRPRTDVLYLVSTENLNLFVKNNGVSYQLQRVDEWQEKFNQKTRTNYKQIERQTFYRIDLSWVNANSDFKKIEDKMYELAAQKNQYVRKEISKADAIKYFEEKGDEYKLDLLKDLEDGNITFYTQGNFTDLCRGPHIPDTGFIKAIKLTKVAGAYWRGDETKKQLTRVYGVTFLKQDRKSTRLNSSHIPLSRMPSSA